jgi:chemosensory pili system protein ChpB (putative protein-glutamate methylesterase)
VQIGIVAAGDLSRHVLKNLLQESGYGARCFSAAQLADCLADVQQLGEARPDAWVVDGADTDVDELLDQLVSLSDAPFLITEEAPPLQQSVAYDIWRRRLLDKIDELTASLGAAPWSERQVPVAVWVLAASTGGPEAVSRFLAALTPGLPIAMVYAQHIEANFDRVLAGALERHKNYAITMGRGEQHLRPGSLLVVPADRQLRFLPFHRVVETRKRWEGRYQPAIDQVIAELGRIYQQRCGVIIFSGLCDDGALGCRVLQARGGEIWVQSPECCVSPDMPNAALATGSVSRQGTPEQLARALSSRYAA